MVVKLKPMVRALCLLSLSVASNSIYAAVPTEAAMQKIAQQTQQLQDQMDALQKQMVQLRQEQAALQSTPAPKHTTKKAATSLATPKTVIKPPVNKNTPIFSEQTVSAEQLDNQPTKFQEITLPNGTSTTNLIPYGQRELANIGGFAVITSPLLNPEQEFIDGDLIVNYSSINKDVNMMRQRQAFSNVMASQGFGLPAHGGSLLVLSGEVQGQANAIRTFDDQHLNDLYVADAELDMQAFINKWITAFMSFSYDNTPNAVGKRLGGDIGLDSAFFTFGNLNLSKWRLTVGQTYVPFGQYNSYLISDPLNKLLFRTKGQPLIVGYGVPGQDGLALSAYTFKGAAHDTGSSANPNPRINQYGADGVYTFHLKQLKTSFGVSYIADIADASSMQNTGLNNGEFEGFGDNTYTERLAHNVPGLDARVLFNISDYILVGEYSTATESFSPADVSYNGNGARPQAYHIEGIYSFDFFSKPSTFALGYDHTYQSLAFNVPEQRIAAAMNTSFWRNTLASLELRHDWNYSESDYASGVGAVINTVPLGSSSNAIFAQFQVYF